MSDDHSVVLNRSGALRSSLLFVVAVALVLIGSLPLPAKTAQEENPERDPLLEQAIVADPSGNEFCLIRELRPTL